MDDDLLTLLQTNKIFSLLSTRTLRRLTKKFQKVELESGEVLYHQGDSSDSMDVLLSGRLETALTTMDGENKIIGEVTPGETVGELGALSGQPRSVTLRANRSSVLFRLSSEEFIELCHQHPSMLFAAINPIATRSHQLIQSLTTEKFKKNIVILPANKKVSLTVFSQNLAELCNESSHLILLSDFEVDKVEWDEESIQAVITEARTKNLKKIKQRFIYLADSTESALAKFSLEKAEMLYVVGESSSYNVMSQEALDVINTFKSTAKTKPELILLHAADTIQPRNTAVWLKLVDFGLHHHVRLDNVPDCRRLIRFIRNKAIGVVLSGGGTRGWAHAGAISALIEAGIPIDSIGGTSVGAIVAASYAMTLSAEKTLSQFRTIIDASRFSVSWRNLTWPAISLFNARGLTTVLQKTFQDVQTEDLWIPFFCVSTNLAKNAETIHRCGELWAQIRSSASIPGVIPPMVQNGELHFDGGLLNNLPVDIMRKIVTQRGTVVAVELVGSNKEEVQYNFPPILPFWQTLLAKLKLGYNYRFPRFIDTFLKSLLAGSFLKAQQNSLAADIFVGLELSRFPMLHSNRKLENKIIEIGYESTMQQIKSMRDKKNS